MSVKIAVFFVILGAVLGEEQNLGDFLNCQQSTTFLADVQDCLTKVPIGINGFSEVLNFYQSNVNCSLATRISELYTCLTDAQRKCLTDERWYSLGPTSKQYGDASTYFCEQSAGSFKLSCIVDNVKEFAECASTEQVDLSKPETVTFDEYKDFQCKALAASEPCYTSTMKASCEDTGKILTEIQKRTKPSACGVWGLTCSLSVLLLSYILLKLSSF